MEKNKMQITKTKSGRLAFTVFQVEDDTQYKTLAYFSVLECSEMIANETRRFYMFSFGYTSKHYDTAGNAVYKLDFDTAYNKRDYLLDGYKFSEKAFSEIIKTAQNDINIMLYEFNKIFGNRYKIVSEIQDAKLF
jgi:hypothetical protein